VDFTQYGTTIIVRIIAFLLVDGPLTIICSYRRGRSRLLLAFGWWHRRIDEPSILLREWVLDLILRAGRYADKRAQQENSRRLVKA
jgi:hypothetical protein